jgi:alpha-D-ribose 1-methylphosphonate 5-triphosphate synthase subunit PhnG
MRGQQERKDWLGLLAKSPAALVADLWHSVDAQCDFEWLRPPEIGSVMVRGRLGGTGAPFNLGEMTVTRCSLRLLTGQVGHGYVQGRDKSHARIAALVDALMQSNLASDIEMAMLQPLRDEMRSARAQTQARADKTKVDFFTMVRGED